MPNGYPAINLSIHPLTPILLPMPDRRSRFKGPLEPMLLGGPMPIYCMLAAAGVPLVWAWLGWELREGPLILHDYLGPTSVSAG